MDSPAENRPDKNSLVEILTGAADRYGDRTSLGIHQDDGTELRWSFRELERRSRYAAWRLRALGLKPGDRLLTWAPSSPALPAVYFGAMRAGVIFVPLDLRMSADAIERIAARAEAGRLALGTGRDAPDPRDAGLENFPTTSVDELAAEPDESFPHDWESVMDTWARPRRDDVF
jgi:acyl-CoA synthetase (AMP-forming)/AMP-acid ligase II